MRNLDMPKLASILIHIYNDAAVKVQLDTKNPPEIHDLYQSMRAKGFSDMDALHQIAFVLQEVSWSAKADGGSFDMNQYVEKVKKSVETVLTHPELARTSRLS